MQICSFVSKKVHGETYEAVGPVSFCSLSHHTPYSKKVHRETYKANFEKFDRDRSGQIDTWELREALTSLGFTVPPVVLIYFSPSLTKTADTQRLSSTTISSSVASLLRLCDPCTQGLTEKFKEKDTMYSGNATFTYEAFMLTVLPFLIV
ncbi:probable calcium-binding protein CML49 [Tanacetum coccineum]